jgi:hypothetical protein
MASLLDVGAVAGPWEGVECRCEGNWVNKGGSHTLVSAMMEHASFVIYSAECWEL